MPVGEKQNGEKYRKNDNVCPCFLGIRLFFRKIVNFLNKNNLNKNEEKKFSDRLATLVQRTLVR
jgi:hypothetical protein